MELTNKTLEDLIRADYDPLRQQALLHAIKASVKKTIFNCENPVENSSANITSEKKDSLINGKNNMPDSPKYIHFTDQTLITNNIKLKDAENTRKQIVRQKLDSMQSLLQSQDTKTKLKMQEKLEAQRREFRQRQNEAEKQILAEIERQSAQESQESQRKSETEHQKQLRVIENFRQNKKTLALRLAFDKIAVYQLKFKEPCENIVKNLRSVDSSLLPNCEEFNRSLKSLVESFDQLLQRIKRLDIKQDDVALAQDLYEKMYQLEQQISAEIENVKRSAEVPQQPPPTCEPDGVNQAPPQQIENVQQQAVTPTGNVPASPNVLNDSELSSFISVARLNFYTRVMSIFRSVEDDVKILQNNPELKKFRSTCQKAVNIPVNAISAVSPEHLKDKFDKLLNLLQGATVSTPDGPFRCTDHPLGKNFCLLLLAKKFVSQGDSAVSSNFQAAFPIAMVIVSLWQKFPEFGTLFLAGVYRECPYLVPYFVPQFQNQPIEDYYKILGYRIVDGSLEKQDMYLKRQAGITRLFGAVMITAGQDRSLSHPYKVENGWIWLCEILNLEPLPDICATVILEFLQTVGYELWRIYKGQFEKLLHFMQSQYLVKLNQVDEGGPKARLEVFLQRVIANKTIDKPQGLLPTQYWR